MSLAGSKDRGERAASEAGAGDAGAVWRLSDPVSVVRCDASDQGPAQHGGSLSDLPERHSFDEAGKRRRRRGGRGTAGAESPEGARSKGKSVMEEPAGAPVHVLSLVERG